MCASASLSAPFAIGAAPEPRANFSWLMKPQRAAEQLWRMTMTLDLSVTQVSQIEGVDTPAMAYDKR
jgi:hypothetical protein